MADASNVVIHYKEVLEFWFTEPATKLWFKPTPEFDEFIFTKFHSLWLRAKENHLSLWEKSAEGCLALAIVLDQFPLNMFRDTSKSFSTEADAIRISRYAIANSFDEALDKSHVSFLYMPLMHSENIQDQNLSVKLFKQANLENNLRYAKHHRDIIANFGRFPHRNMILNRISTTAELKYLASPQAFKG